MTPRREMMSVILAIALGAMVALVAAQRPRVTVGSSGQIPDADTPAATALALVALAGIGALLIVRPWGRVVIGVLLAAVGLGLVAVFFSPADDAGLFAYTPGQSEIRRSAWAWLGAAAGLLVGAGAATVVLRARRWPAARERYGASAPRVRGDDPWDALDRGEDPTS